MYLAGVRSIAAVGARAAFLLSCSVQLVSPFDADLQKRASDLTSEISAWEMQMRSQAGTVATDPRNPQVQAALQRWLGELEAMQQLQFSTDPGLIECRAAADSVLRQVQDLVASQKQKTLMRAIAAASPTEDQAAQAGSAPAKSCEAIPISLAAKDVGLLQKIMEQQCRVPGADDAFFESAQDDKLAAAAGTRMKAGVKPAAAGSPTEKSQAMCLAVFLPPSVAGSNDPHGPPVSAIIGDLNAIVFIEGKKKPGTAGG